MIYCIHRIIFDNIVKQYPLTVHFPANAPGTPKWKSRLELFLQEFRCNHLLNQGGGYEGRKAC
jgi:hypothetical protein